MSFVVPTNVQLTKEYRQITGLGLLESINALKATNWDLDLAVGNFRKSTGKIADGRSHRQTREGICEAYIHTGGKISTMVELNCETDFVARLDTFKQLARDLCMQVAATNPVYISIDDIPLPKKMELEEEYRALAGDKPPSAVAKFIQGRMEKFYATFVLLEQPFIRNQDVLIKDRINEMIVQTKENIKVSRIARFQVGLQ